MTPNDYFYYVKGAPPESYSRTLTQLYLPIIGSDGLALYAYLTTFWDNGTDRHRFSEILNHLQLGMTRVEEALAVLTSLDLVCFYHYQDHYLIALRPALDSETFLNHSLYSRLLIKKIGEPAVSVLKKSLPDQARDLSKSFSEVFSDLGELAVQPIQKVSGFDLISFKHRMEQEGLRFANASDDELAICHFADRYQMNWYEVYELAKATAYNRTILLPRMKAQKESIVGSDSELSSQEQVILQQAKSEKCDVLLAQLKQARNAVVTADERQLLNDLAQRGFLDEVINVMIIYTFAKTKSANLNKAYVTKIANDFAYEKLATAEAAIARLRSFDQRKTANAKAKPARSNVPEWSQEDYKNETSQAEQEHLAEIKRQMLAKLGRGE